MRLYLEVARRGFRRYASYPGAAWAGVFTNTVFGFLRAYVMIALFAAAGRAIGGFTLRDALTYVFLTQGILMTIYMWGWWDISLAIRSGQIAVDLYRPVDFQAYWLAQDAGRAVYHALARGIVPFVVGAIALDLRLPAHAATWPLFGASMVLAVLVSFGIRFLGNLTTFWLLDHRGVGAMVAGAWTILGGFVVPIAFFPGPLRTIATMLPFASTVQAPIDVFLERTTGAAAAAIMALQAAWGVVLLVAGRLVLGVAARRLVVQGG